MEYMISELCEIISGGTPLTSDASFWNGDIPWISIADFIGVNRFVEKTAKKITKAGLKSSSTNLLNRNDIIISARGTVGKVALAFSDMAFNQSCYGLKTKNPEFLLNQYLFYWLRANVQQVISATHGSVFDTITKNTFETLEIEVPSLAEQHHIVDTIPC